MILCWSAFIVSHSHMQPMGCGLDKLTLHVELQLSFSLCINKASLP